MTRVQQPGPRHTRSTPFAEAARAFPSVLETPPQSPHREWRLLLFSVSSHYLGFVLDKRSYKEASNPEQHLSYQNSVPMHMHKSLGTLHPMSPQSIVVKKPGDFSHTLMPSGSLPYYEHESRRTLD